MKFRIIYTLLGALSLALLFMGNSGGRAATGMWGSTGAPGDQEAAPGVPWTCQNCHGGAIGMTMDIEVFEVGTNTVVTEYVAGTTYDVKVTLNHMGGDAPAGYGFQIVSLIDADESDVAGWSNPSGSVQISTAAMTDRSYAEHDGMSVSNEFNVQWTAPTGSSGSVTFYAAGIGANGDGTSAADGGATASLSLQEMLVGINDVFDLNVRVKVYPNPVTSYVNVEINSEFSGAVLAEIIDMQGRIIETRTIELTSGQNEARFEANHLNVGTYLVRLNKDNKILTTQFVKK